MNCDPTNRPIEEDDFPGAVLDPAESQHLIQELVDFVVGDGETSVSIGELRQVMDEQIGRARRRMRGIEQINELLRSSVGRVNSSSRSVPLVRSGQIIDFFRRMVIHNHKS